MIRKRYQSTINGIENYVMMIEWVRLSLYGKVIKELTGNLADYHIVSIKETIVRNDRADFINVFLIVIYESNIHTMEVKEVD